MPTTPSLPYQQQNVASNFIPSAMKAITAPTHNAAKVADFPFQTSNQLRVGSKRDGVRLEIPVSYDFSLGCSWIHADVVRQLDLTPRATNGPIMVQSQGLYLVSTGQFVKLTCPMSDGLRQFKRRLAFHVMENAPFKLLVGSLDEGGSVIS